MALVKVAGARSQEEESPARDAGLQPEASHETSRSQLRNSIGARVSPGMFRLRRECWQTPSDWSYVGGSQLVSLTDVRPQIPENAPERRAKPFVYDRLWRRESAVAEFVRDPLLYKSKRSLAA